MSVNVKGRNIDVTPALKEYVEKKITKVTKQFKTVGDISAVLKVEKGNHIVEITVPASGILLRAQETTKDMYSSIDLVVEKIERQIHKYKTRLMKRKYSNFADTAVFDFGGPVNKTMSLFSDGLLVSGVYGPEAVKFVGSIIPPFGITLSFSISYWLLTRRRSC